jgi:hypothetical protein
LLHGVRNDAREKLFTPKFSTPTYIFKYRRLSCDKLPYLVNHTTMKQAFILVTVLCSAFCSYAQNVGIGITDPISKLHVRATELGTAIFESNHGTGTWTSIKNTSTNGREWSLISTGINNGEGAGHLLFYSTGQIRAMIHQNGNVGIGTTTPAFKLDVVGTTRFRGGDHILESNSPGGTWFYLVNTSGTPTGWKLITTGTANGTAGAFTMFNDNNAPGFTLRQNGNAGFGTFDPLSRLHVFTADNNTAMFESESNVGTWVGFKNSSAGGKEWSVVSTGTNSFEGAGHLLFINGGQVITTLNGNGNVGIGTSNPIHRLDVAGNIRLGSGRVYFSDRYFQLSTYVNGGIAILPHTNNVGALGFNEFYWNKAHINDVYYSFLIEVSDARAKKNIQPLGNVMDKIAQLQPVRFDIDPATHPGFKNASPEEIEQAKGTMGFTAQNIKEVFPSMVEYNEEMGVYTVRNYNQLLSVLVQGMKEQQEIITRLEESVRQLKAAAVK